MVFVLGLRGAEVCAHIFDWEGDFRSKPELATPVDLNSSNKVYFQHFLQIGGPSSGFIIYY